VTSSPAKSATVTMRCLSRKCMRSPPFRHSTAPFNAVRGHYTHVHPVWEPGCD
jgi:hypothetical protein